MIDKRLKNIAFLLVSCLAYLAVPVMSGQDNNGKKTGIARIAACQFPVSADIRLNYEYISNQMTEAKLKKADIVQFPECALSGYPGTDMLTLDNFNWEELRRMTDSVLILADKLDLWVVLGSLHRLTGNHKPHNCLYVITPDGKITDRYDKRFCTGTDLQYCSPGDHFVTFSVNGISYGLLICYDVRFPELFREYRKLGCDVIFHSFYNARSQKGFIHPVIMPVTSQANAATNYFYISLSNSSAPESWPCHFITPDGLIQNKLTPNQPGILISNIDISEQFYDASREYRNDAMKGKLNSGQTVSDQRSDNRQSY